MLLLQIVCWAIFCSHGDSFFVTAFACSVQHWKRRFDMTAHSVIRTRASNSACMLMPQPGWRCRVAPRHSVSLSADKLDSYEAEGLRSKNKSGEVSMGPLTPLQKIKVLRSDRFRLFVAGFTRQCRENPGWIAEQDAVLCRESGWLKMWKKYLWV